ncbi:unnamed protein product [Fusarium venenatum]|uniref:Uncharacterized protein n=1 Tax=Fusarium venenatum TaxID=56646 RepID=A0A2L2TB08_9HYPO|nr:uncharacterized protein FVRRES_08221 [Fusarium venenatum]CEI68144.1 unnamed protein product [Fusarium venenatum]
MHVDGDGDAGTPLLVAARRGHLDVCNLLIQHRARVEGNGEDSPLTRASSEGYEDICRLLLDKGATERSVSQY